MIFKMLFSQQLYMHCSQWLLWEDITLRFLNSFVLIVAVTVFNLMILNHFVGKTTFLSEFLRYMKIWHACASFHWNNTKYTSGTASISSITNLLQRTPLGHHVISDLNSCIGIMSTTFYVMFQIFYQSRINKNFSQPKFDS